MTKPIVLAATYAKGHAACLHVLEAYFENCGWQMQSRHGRMHYRWLADADWQIAIVWNGLHPKHRESLAALAQSRTLLYAEVGWFPGHSGGRPRTMYLDPQGTNFCSEIRAFEPPELMPSEREQLHNWIESYRRSQPPQISIGWKDYVLVPLQLFGDTAIRCGSTFRHMQQVIDLCERYIDRSIVFVRHPLDSKVYKTTRRDTRIVYDAKSIQLLDGAHSVVGVNSTFLLEGLALGKRVASLGIGVFSDHGVLFECAEAPERLRDFSAWMPSLSAADAFLYELIFRRQIDLTHPTFDRNRVLETFFSRGVMRTSEADTLAGDGQCL